ncbi:1317_t:CDS:2, partial [Cetraspora pellucida]
YNDDNDDNRSNKDVPYSWLRVTGGDFSDFYQEQLFIDPLVIDWAEVNYQNQSLLKETTSI